MPEITVSLAERSYPITLGSSLLDRIGASLSRLSLGTKVGLVSNPTVYGLYGDRVARSLKDAGFSVTECVIPDGEEYKSLESLHAIYDGLLAARLDRTSALLALGGGVIGDITGFAASTYMRGIAFVQVPTTLLAQVDSSVGGKTGVNHPLGKNMIGTFWQPRFVLIDVDTLKTLPRRELFAGFAEVIKYGVIRDAALFTFLEKERDTILRSDREALVKIIRRSCEIKADVVSRDERESGLRAILNFGHTIGHAVETATGYTRYLHGEAVAIGMCAEARLSVALGLLESTVPERIERLCAAYGLPTQLPDDVDAAVLLDAMQHDKKTVSGSLTFILPREIGTVEIRSGIEAGPIRTALTRR